jgi:hypothetical protein
MQLLCLKFEQCLQFFFHFVQNVCNSDKVSILSLKTRNNIYNTGIKISVHRKFVSGSGACELSGVTKCSYRQKCGFQNQFSSPSCKLPVSGGKVKLPVQNFEAMKVRC